MKYRMKQQGQDGQQNAVYASVNTLAFSDVRLDCYGDVLGTCLTLDAVPYHRILVFTAGVQSPTVIVIGDGGHRLIGQLSSEMVFYVPAFQVAEINSSQLSEYLIISVSDDLFLKSCKFHQLTIGEIIDLPAIAGDSWASMSECLQTLRDCGDGEMECLLQVVRLMVDELIKYLRTDLEVRSEQMGKDCACCGGVHLPESVRAYIEEHIDQPLNMSQIADNFHYGRHYIARSYRARYGCSCMQSLQAMRLIKARRHLTENGCRRSLCEVAYMSGYADQAHMTRQFRERLGFTPGEYQSAQRMEMSMAYPA